MKWKCKYGDEVEKVQTILSSVGEVEGPYDFEWLSDDEKYLIGLGFVERAFPCGHELRDNGEVLYFKDKGKAMETYVELKRKEGKVVEKYEET